MVKYGEVSGRRLLSVSFVLWLSHFFIHWRHAKKTTETLPFQTSAQYLAIQFKYMSVTTVIWRKDTIYDTSNQFCIENHRISIKKRHYENSNSKTTLANALPPKELKIFIVTRSIKTFFSNLIDHSFSQKINSKKEDNGGGEPWRWIIMK